MAGKHIIIVLMASGITLLGGLGCVPVQNNPNALVLPPPKTERPGPEVPPMASPKRFQDTMTDATTSAESVMEMTKRYTALHEEAAALRDENRTISAENVSLKQRIATLEADLKQAQSELAEANDLLMEILMEMNTWKNNVLGFRSEMRQASKAELEALLKILEILGADVGDPNTAAASADTGAKENN